MFINFPSSKEIKKERIAAIINCIDKILDTFTDKKMTKGYTVLVLHWLFVILEFGFFSLFSVNIVSIIIIFSIMLIHGYAHIYYGGSGCIITRIERNFFDDNEWYGPITILYRMLGISTTHENHRSSEIIHGIAWIVLVIYMVYKIYKTYTVKLQHSSSEVSSTDQNPETTTTLDLFSSNKIAEKL